MRLLLWRTVCVSAFVLAAIAIAPVAAQAPPTQNARTASSWTAPRTPWGDPDLQGTYTNTYEDGTPFERPEQFAGRKLEDVKGEELRAIRKAAEERAIAAFKGPEHGPDHWWQDNLSLEKGSQAWFIVDPDDGKIPPLTAEARLRASRRSPEGERTRSRRFMGGPQLVRPLSHPRTPRLDDAGDLRQPVSDRPGAGLRRDPV
jgi:hypothetical protein